MATTIARGLAIINAIVGGVPTNISAWASISVQTTSVTQNFEMEEVKDSGGFTASRQARNAKLEKKISFKPTSTTLALAKTATVLLAPLATLTFSGSDASDFDGSWQLLSGSEIQIKNDATAEYSVNCDAFQDSTQRALILSTPS